MQDTRPAHSAGYPQHLHLHCTKPTVFWFTLHHILSLQTQQLYKQNYIFSISCIKCIRILKCSVCVCARTRVSKGQVDWSVTEEEIWRKHPVLSHQYKPLPHFGSTATENMAIEILERKHLCLPNKTTTTKSESILNSDTFRCQQSNLSFLKEYYQDDIRASQAFVLIDVITVPAELCKHTPVPFV